ncbi:MAG TPA: hypothetical protein VEU33_51185, partial [Archangium sp.]|nr:hypothetical protein [Archangium sp.]
MQQPWFRREKPFSSTSCFFAATLLSGVLVASFPSMALAAIVSDPNCSKNVLPGNDDNWVSAPIGFSLAMGGAIHTDNFIDNNGYVSFGGPAPRGGLLDSA